MKYVIILIVLIATFASTTYAYCSYKSKSGEYDGNKSYSHGSTVSRKICVYDNGKIHIPVAFFNQYYCPYSIEYDEYRDRICDWN